MLNRVGRIGAALSSTLRVRPLMAVLAVALALPIAGIATIGGSAGADTTIAVPTDYPTVQAAITAAEALPGGQNVTITIAAGTYTENDTIAASGLTSLTLKGAGESTTTLDGGSKGAVLTIVNGDVVVSGFTIATGSDANGGGIDDISSGSTLQVTNDLFNNDRASNSAGAINDVGLLSLVATDDVFFQDQAGNSGGAIAAVGLAPGTVTATDDTFLDDTGTNFAGAIANLSGVTLTATNDTFFGNTSAVGGGIDNNGTLIATDDTFVDNGGSVSGGAIHNTGTATIRNTILADPLRTLGTTGADCAGTAPVDGGYNVADDGSCFTSTTSGSLSNNQDLNIGFGTLQNNTVAIGTTSSAFELVPAANCTVTTDERGAVRPGYPTQPNCDAGAYELQEPETKPSVSTSPVSAAYSATTETTALGAVDVTADAGRSYSVVLDAGTSTGGTINDRLATSTSDPTKELSYQLYTGASRAFVWGDGMTGGIVSALGSGAKQTFSVFAAIPSGQGALSSGVYTDAVKVTVTEGSQVSTATLDVSISVDSPPSITSAAATNFTSGSSGTFTVSTSGTPTVTSISSSDVVASCMPSTLPSGVTFTDNGDGTATIAAMATAVVGGVYTLCLTATNGVSPDATQTFTLTVDTAPAITSADAATFTSGTANSFTVTATGSPTPTLTNPSAGLCAPLTLPDGVTFIDNGDGTATISST
ncbi:MAG TPA: spore coat protein U domain-containing protein, partial [Acidimicrobiales bacterium]|nr:spore coat protein U domain-containing protein [Acidimicrobiales bacterium]